jgi:hypothetical protein
MPAKCTCTELRARAMDTARRESTGWADPLRREGPCVREIRA